MKKIEFNLIDNIFFTTIIVIVGLGGFGKMGVALAIPIIVIYLVFRPYIVKKFINKNNSKEPENQKEFDEFDD